MELSEIEILLAEFDTLPKKIKEPTYLELCKYPGSRFEEICSRLLCFFLDPQKEHGFKDLFLRSLFEILVPQKEFLINTNNVHVKNEENAEGKRLDILIHSSNFVIGIENKITAGIYNPFEIYKNQIQLYGRADEDKFRVVLSLRKISNKNDLAFIKSHEFISLTYKDYFEKIKMNLGFYLNNCNQKYLLFLTDFIQTLENMSGNNILNKELSNYFFENSGKIEEVTTLFQQFKNKTLSTQIERIAELKDSISDITKDANWRVWEEYLVISKFNPNKPEIGIEGSFDATKGNALGMFCITITTWVTLKNWAYYEEKILKDFAKSELTKDDGRAVLIIDRIQGDREDLILESLKKCYDYLVILTCE